jgi:hypothetical protein
MQMNHVTLRDEITEARVEGEGRAAIAFPNSEHWNPVNGRVVGTEYPTFRYIFKYDTKPTRKYSNQENEWPNGELYLVERDVKFLDGAE